MVSLGFSLGCSTCFPSRSAWATALALERVQLSPRVPGMEVVAPFNVIAGFGQPFADFALAS